jgi:hypothetical protein
MVLLQIHDDPPSSRIVLTVGRVDAWDGKQASAKIAREIIKWVARVPKSANSTLKVGRQQREMQL